MNITVVGIHTGIGKTVASAIICEAMQVDYWKPVQAGSLDNTDTNEVERLISNGITAFHKEAYRLTQPMSPYAAAKLDRSEIAVENIFLPKTNNHLVIETAGG